jgi:hypothetical protein
MTPLWFGLSIGDASLTERSTGNGGNTEAAQAFNGVRLPSWIVRSAAIKLDLVYATV